MDALADEEEPAPTGSLREEESAEDILAQSLTFARTTRLPGRVRYPSVGSIERAGDSEELLPPAMATMEHCPVDASQEEEKTEIGEEEPYVMATASVAMATQEATVIGADDDDDLTTLKRQAYHGLADQSACHVSPHSPTQQATAFVIEDGDHASLTLDAVEAEFVRPDFNAPMPEPLPDDSPAVTGYSSLADEEETATEATVIDSAPLAGHHPDDEDLPAYKLHGEAQVLEDASSLASMDRKPAAIGDDDDEDDDDNGDFAVADQQAEVVGLQEEVHPMEFDDDTEAELIGTDYTVGVAVATGQPDHLDAEAEYTFVNEEAEVLDIRENMHPLEYGGTDATEAELLGTNFSVGVAVTPRASASVERGFATEATAELGSQVGQGYAIRVTVDSTAVAEGSVTVVDEESAPATLMHDDAIHATPVHTQGGPGEPSTPASAIPVAAAFTSRFDGEEGREISVEESIRSDPTDPVKPPPVVAAAAAAVLPEMDENAANPIGKTAASEGTLEEDPPDWLRDVAGSPPAPPPQPRPFGDAREKSETSGASEGSLRNLQMFSTQVARGTANVMETLFGDSPPPFLSRRDAPSDLAARRIRPRTLLPWSVIYSPSTNMWVATLQTNQKALDSNNVSEASKSLRAFSLPSDKQAVCLAKSWAPPRMHAFADNRICHICETRFAILRRPCHCRNCGVCVCRECTVPWPSKMIPEAYNHKRENSVNICKSCDWLSTAFRLALLEGNFDKAVALCATSNVNLNTPFANVKGELFYPVHCAVIGGNLDLLQWLVDEHCCPIKSVRVSGKTRNGSATYTPIVTSKGRSLLGIAMEHANVPVIRYLVVKKGISLAGEKDITPAMLITNLEAVLRLLPEDGAVSAAASANNSGRMSSTIFEHASAPSEEEFFDMPTPGARSLSEEARDFGAIQQDDSDHRDECIICCDRKIDCVATPCGHQVMCLVCSESTSRCPVCAAECTYLRIYRA